jgi:YidC/Oxa1 family membrane protein insertase
MGLAIIFFSLFLRFILNPLTKPYMESMKKIKAVAPKLDKLKKKYKKDKVKLAQAQSELYKQEGINPGAGCLPYLLQIIILIAFFNVFNRTLNQPDPIAAFNELLYEPMRFVNGATLNTKFLYLDLTKPDKFVIAGLPFPIPGFVLLFAAFTQFLSAKIMQPITAAKEKLAKKTKTQEDDIQVAMQSSMTYMFPLMTVIFGLSFPSGLAIYWALFSLWQTVSQYRSSGAGGLTPWLTKLGIKPAPAKS